jgi:hypothetical protein
VSFDIAAEDEDMLVNLPQASETNRVTFHLPTLSFPRDPRALAAAAAKALLPILAYPAIILGALLVFVLSAQTALTLFAAHADTLTSPISARDDVSVPPVRQIADINPAPVRSAPRKTVEPESSFVTIAAPKRDVAEAVPAPTESSIQAVASPATARIGPQAVNVRSAPSKTSTVLGVVNAGTPVNVLAMEQGWVRINSNGQSGWVYSSFLEGGNTVTMTISDGASSVQ